MVALLTTKTTRGEFLRFVKHQMKVNQFTNNNTRSPMHEPSDENDSHTL
jgi:hypothetical protein